MKDPAMSDQCPALPRSPSALPQTMTPIQFWRRVLQAMQVQKSRHRLSQLEPHLLADIGLTEAQAAYKAKRAAWDAPQIWRNRD